MHFKAQVCLLAYLVGLSCAKSLNLNPDIAPSEVSEILKTENGQSFVQTIEHEIDQEVRELPQKDIMALARQRAIHVIMEKMLFALGPDFLEGNHGFPDNETYPTVASPLNLTTDPCPEIYMKCSSENFLSSCHPPEDTNIELWNQRLNLYFELPLDLLDSDSLLNATLRIYKNNSLPLRPSARLIVELYVYKKSLTKAYDINFLYDSRSISNDYIGWISFEVTDLVRRLNLSEHHGFLIKVKELVGFYWNDPTLIVPMNCSGDDLIVPIPFGVVTDQPEQKYPSLTITTGVKDKYHYSGFESEHTYNNHDTLEEYFFDHEFERNVEHEGNHQEIGHDYEKAGRVKNRNHRILNFDLDYQDFGQVYEEQSQNNEWIDNGEQIEEMHTLQKRHHQKQKSKQRRDHKKKKAHRELLPVEEEEYEELYDNFENEYDPIEYIHLPNRNSVQKYDKISFRKPVKNQVYNSPVSAEHMDLPLPAAKTSVDSLSPAKSVSTKSSEIFESHHNGSKRRDRHRRRHHNHHHGENSESHRSLHPRSHARSDLHKEPDDRQHGNSVRHESGNLNLQLNS